jgi:hypothetical protein
MSSARRRTEPREIREPDDDGDGMTTCLSRLVRRMRSLRLGLASVVRFHNSISSGELSGSSGSSGLGDVGGAVGAG